MALSSLSTKVVRDLWWVMGSAHLLGERSGPSIVPDAWAASVVERSAEWLRALDAEPGPLVAFIHAARGRSRLGHYCAALIEYWLTESPALCVNELVSGVQLEAASGEGLGQLKFLWATKGADEVTHWELHIKFFLFATRAMLPAEASGAQRAHTPVERCLERFVGPFVGETLLDRVRILSHRLALADSPPLRRWLGERRRGETARESEPSAALAEPRVVSHGVLRGTLFYALRRADACADERGAGIAGTEGCYADEQEPGWAGVIGAAHARGWYAMDLDAALLAFPGSRWALPRGEGSGKFHWLSAARAVRSAPAGGDAAGPALHIAGEPLLKIEAVPVLDAAQMAPIAREALGYNGGTPILLLEMRPARRTEDTAAGAGADAAAEADEWLEGSRGFVLPPNWDPAPLWQRAPHDDHGRMAGMVRKDIEARRSGLLAQAAGTAARDEGDGALGEDAEAAAGQSSRARAALRYHGRAMAAVSDERIDLTTLERVHAVRLTGEPRAAGGRTTEASRAAAAAARAVAAASCAPIGSAQLFAALGLGELTHALAEQPRPHEQPQPQQLQQQQPDSAPAESRRRLLEVRGSGESVASLVLATDAPARLVLDALHALDALALAEPAGEQCRRAAAHALVDALLGALSAHERACVPPARGRQSAPPPPLHFAYAGHVCSAEQAARALLRRLLRAESQLCARAVARAVKAVSLKLAPSEPLACELRAVLDACAGGDGLGGLAAESDAAGAAAATLDAPRRAHAAALGAVLLSSVAIVCGVSILVPPPAAVAAPPLPTPPQAATAAARLGGCAADAAADARGARTIARLLEALLLDASPVAEGTDRRRAASALLAHARAELVPTAAVSAREPRDASASAGGTSAAAQASAAFALEDGSEVALEDGSEVALEDGSEVALEDGSEVRMCAAAAGGGVRLSHAAHVAFGAPARRPCGGALAAAAGASSAPSASALPPYALPAGCVQSLVHSEAELLAFAHAMERAANAPDAVLGLDVEWRPDGRDAAPPPTAAQPPSPPTLCPQPRARNPPSVLQIAVGRRASREVERVWVVDLLRLEGALADESAAGRALGAAARAAEAGLRAALHSSCALKLGFAFQEDLARLHYESARLRCFDRVAPLCDLRVAALLDARAHEARYGGFSLCALVGTCARLCVDKAEQCSDWQARPLSAAQLRYAATDAACLLDLHRALHALAPHALAAATSDARPPPAAGLVRARPGGALAAPSPAALARVRAAVARVESGAAWLAPAALAAPTRADAELNAICVLAPQHAQPQPAQPAARCFLVLTDARCKLHLRALADALGVERLRLAYADECERLFGANAGFVPPVPLADGVSVVLHPSLRAAARVWASGGDAGMRLWVERPAEGVLETLTGGRWLDDAPQLPAATPDDAVCDA